jgi:hypothetical protein
MADACACTTWARTDGRLTEHNPACKNFRQSRYVRVTLVGHGCYVQPASAMNVLLDEIGEAEPGAKWTLELIELTQEEYDRLPEFTGH